MLGYRGTMCSRQHSQACLNTSLSIRQEIQRFESVHPSIYALYDLVELVPDPLLAQQIRDHVVAIEGEWKMSGYPANWHHCLRSKMCGFYGDAARCLFR
ncbi:hypothetical protein O3G_MSEX008725 [Manduca sexta]|uniref:Uncharacterized protein n=1 Tax=Manduca sexta TaxID=7130 RepID=A0A921ZAI4_MANSE|nr:hypothetical protein O3G_MSEX008725 [Manduca sexta]